MSAAPLPRQDERSLVAAELPAAVLRNEFTLHYQPQWTADGSTIVAVEALVRWAHPTLGLLTPDRFLDVAEDLGLLSALTERLLDRACRETAPWAPIGVALNVSPKQFTSPGFIGVVEATLARTGFPARRLELEIVETAVFDDLGRAEKILSALRERGVRIALDDFGTGHSSLTLLQKLPIDKVKIDRSFICDVATTRSAAIVQAVIAVARAIGLKVTAEGVETEAEQRFLKIAGCHYIQGYLLARPAPAAAVAALLAERGIIRAA